MKTLEKLLTVGVFAIFLYFIIDWIMGMVSEQIITDSISPTIKYYLCALGIYEAVNIFVSFLVASWFTNKIIDFLSS
ncbi:MAG: hypothetical protein RBR54_06115 [Sulfurimonas sp.]|jgi:hypothetical protein|nr:hypothetical protein [Sulfurimonas sp.]